MSPGNPDTTSSETALEETEPCISARELLNRVGDKWSVLVIQRLTSRTYRFNELKHSIDGISQRMLTLTLRHLERDGLVERTVYPTVPPRVEYTLTQLGRTACSPLRALLAWAEAHGSDVARARAAYDERTS